MPVRSVFIVLAALVGVASAWLPGGAQQAGKVYRVGFLTSGTPGVYARYVEGFKLGLRELGYIEGQNIVVDYRFGEGSNERTEELAAELVRSNVDIIVASAFGAFAAKKATTSIPIVFLSITDPIRFGFVSSLARSGGNMTGLTYTGIELNPKRLEMLRETLPRATRFAALGTSKHSLWGHIVEELQAAARVARIQLQIVDAGASSAADIDAAFETISKGRPQGLLVLQYHQFVFETKRIVDLAARYRIPAIYELRGFPEFGGLMSYAGDLLHQFRRAAIYVDKILKGANPAELPVEQPTKFELVINKKAAHALGLTIPPSVLGRADHVIEQRLLDQRGPLLRAAVGFATCSLPSYDSALHALRTWLDSWAGIGHVAVGMHRQGYDLQLTQYDDRGWRATFYTTRMEHSPTSATGTAWERTPWRATQRAAWEALKKVEREA